MHVLPYSVDVFLVSCDFYFVAGGVVLKVSGLVGVNTRSIFSQTSPI